MWWIFFSLLFFFSNFDQKISEKMSILWQNIPFLFLFSIFGEISRLPHTHFHNPHLQKGKTRSGFIMDSCATSFFLISGHLSMMDWQVRLHTIQEHAYQIWSEYYSIIWLLDHRSGFYLTQMTLARSVKWLCWWDISIWNVNLKLLARSRMCNTITITIEQTNMGIGPNSHKNSGNEK